jgi:hypothetical protein
MELLEGESVHEEAWDNNGTYCLNLVKPSGNFTYDQI